MAPPWDGSGKPEALGLSYDDRLRDGARRRGRNHPIEPGTLIEGRYRLESRLAAGATSEVFVGCDEKLDRRVAIKVLHGETGDRQRFAGEVRLLAALDHPNLVRVYDAVDQPQPVLIMELIKGQSLDERLATGPLTDEQVHRLGADLADCLMYLHQRGVVHRDIKPANILLGDDGRPRLADFGIARLVDATRLTQAGQTIGTLAYMAPEQLTGQAVGPPADLYSLGLVMLEALTGRRAFPGSHDEVVAARLARDPDVPPEVSGFWQPLLADMTSRQPERRPTAGAVAQRLRGEGGPEATEVMPANGAATAVDEAATAVDGAANASTVTLPAEVPHLGGAGMLDRRMLAGLAVLVVAVLVAVVLVASRSGRQRSALSPGSITTSPSLTTAQASSTSAASTTSPITTSTTASIQTALAALIRDVVSGETAGTIDPGIGQAISHQSEQAVTDVAAGKANQAANDLQQAARAIAGIQNGTANQAAGATLEADLASLAHALGLSAAGTPPTTLSAPGKHKSVPGKGHSVGDGV